MISHSVNLTMVSLAKFSFSMVSYFSFKVNLAMFSLSKVSLTS